VIGRFYSYSHKLEEGFLTLERANSEAKNIRMSHPFYHHGLKKMISNGKDKWGNTEYEISTNSFGFKSSDTLTVSVYSSNHRILLIGDSFTEGIGIPYDNTFSGLLEQKRKKYPIEIYNAGCVSYSPKIYYLKIKYLIEKEKFYFDNIYVFIDISDIQDEIMYKDFKPADISFDTIVENKSEDEGFLQKINRHHACFSVLRLLKRKLIPRKARPKESQMISQWTFEAYYSEREKWTSLSDKDYPWIPEGQAYAYSHMDSLYQICQKNNISMSIIVYPWPWQITKGLTSDRHTEYWEKFCLDKNIPFLNLYPNFIQSDTSSSEIISKLFIKGDCHWNNNGHKFVYNQLVNWKNIDY
jgi:hypothetical protein